MKAKELIFVLVLLFLVLPIAAANLVVSDLSVGYDLEEGYYGWTEYNYTENTTGYLVIIVDGWLVRMIPVTSGSWTGAREWKTRDAYFPLNQSMGIHNITVQALNIENTMSTNYTLGDD